MHSMSAWRLYKIHFSLIIISHILRRHFEIIGLICLTQMIFALSVGCFSLMETPDHSHHCPRLLRIKMCLHGPICSANPLHSSCAQLTRIFTTNVCVLSNHCGLTIESSSFHCRRVDTETKKPPLYSVQVM